MQNPLNLLALSLLDPDSDPNPEYVESDLAQNVATSEAALDDYIAAHRLPAVEGLKNSYASDLMAYTYREGMKAGARLQLQLLGMEKGGAQG